MSMSLRLQVLMVVISQLVSLGYSVGCSESAAGEIEVVSNAIYACSGTFTGGLQDEGTSTAFDLCDSGYKLCSSATETASFGLTSALCSAISNDANVFYATQESGPGGWQCTSVSGSPGTNDLWGCSSNGNFNHACGVLTSAFNYNWDGWNVGVDGNRESDYVSLSNAANGGVLCCQDPLSIEERCDQFNIDFFLDSCSSSYPSMNEDVVIVAQELTDFKAVVSDQDLANDERMTEIEGTATALQANIDTVAADLEAFMSTLSSAKGAPVNTDAGLLSSIASWSATNFVIVGLLAANAFFGVVICYLWSTLSRIQRKREHDAQYQVVTITSGGSDSD